MTVANITLTWAGILLVAATLQWILMIFAVMFGRVRDEWRGSEVVLVLSTFLFAGAWYAILLRRPPASVQPVVESTSRSCEGVKAGSTDAEVKAKVGQPDHIRDEEETRGPASEVWIYDDIRCAVHFLGDKVESVE